MKTQNSIIPLITLLVMVLSSFFPILHMMMLQTAGQFIYYVSLFFDPPYQASMIANLSLAVLFLLVFLLSKRMGLKIVFYMLAAFFMMSFTALYFSDWHSFDALESGEPYYLPLMKISLVGCLPGLIVGWVKEKYDLANQRSENQI